MRIIRLSGMYVAIEKSPDGKTVACTGIAEFNEEGRLIGEEKGGKLELRTGRQEPSEVKRLVMKHINNGSERTGIEFRVANDRIFLVDKRTYSRMVKEGETRYQAWLGKSD